MFSHNSSEKKRKIMIRSKLTKIVCCVNPNYEIKDGEMSIDGRSKANVNKVHIARSQEITSFL